MMTLDEKTLLLQQQPNLIVLFKYSTFKQVASTKTKKRKMYHHPAYEHFSYKKPFSDEDPWMELYAPNFFVKIIELKEVVSIWDEESKKDYEKKITTNTWYKDVGENGISINKIFWQDKQPSLTICGKSYMFEFTSTKMNEETNTLTLIMELANSEERIIANQNEFDEQFKNLEKEINEYNSKLKETEETHYLKERIEQLKKEREEELHALRKEYKSFSAFKKFFGGEELKKKHHIS